MKFPSANNSFIFDLKITKFDKYDSSYDRDSCENVKAENNFSVWTFLTDDDNYAISSLKLLKSIKLNTTFKFDAYIIELYNKPLKPEIKDLLVTIGWKICKALRIPPKN